MKLIKKPGFFRVKVQVFYDYKKDCDLHGKPKL